MGSFLSDNSQIFHEDFSCRSTFLYDLDHRKKDEPEYSGSSLYFLQFGQYLFPVRGSDTYIIINLNVLRAWINLQDNGEYALIPAGPNLST